MKLRVILRVPFEIELEIDKNLQTRFVSCSIDYDELDADISLDEE